jgi:hypothetical protein
VVSCNQVGQFTFDLFELKRSSEGGPRRAKDGFGDRSSCSLLVGADVPKDCQVAIVEDGLRHSLSG